MNIFFIYCVSGFLFWFSPFVYFYLSWLSYSYKLVKVLSVCVWMLIRVEQIITAAHRDSLSYTNRCTNELLSQNENQVTLTYFTGQNRLPKK